MGCKTCVLLGEMQALANRLKRRVPGLDWTLNAYLSWHLFSAHGLSMYDLGTSPRQHEAAPNAPEETEADWQDELRVRSEGALRHKTKTVESRTS